MNVVYIVLPYDGAEKLWQVWSKDEERIDFRCDRLGGDRCSAAFAAAELKKYLELTIAGMKVVIIGQRPAAGLFIELLIEDTNSWGGFDWLPVAGGLSIKGHGRNGLINGIYEFLRRQGWRWLEPGPRGEIRPNSLAELYWPEVEEHLTPSFYYRAFYFEYNLQESFDVLLWMARNRMNVFGLRPYTAALARKLGMFLQIGGHLFHRILAPSRYLPSGRTIWEEHPEWYGTPSGMLKSIEHAQDTQFCCSQETLIDYLADGLIEELNGSWSAADIIEVSGFDTWGNTCQCEACRRLGTDTDKYLYFMSGIRHRLDLAVQTGRIAHQVVLNSWSYEGTATLTEPTRKIPKNMVDAGDNTVFFPIKRCYRHGIANPDCAENRLYGECCRNWGKHGQSMTLWFGEYYNVSKHEDLPLVFVQRMSEDMRFYYQVGARGATYMHVPIINWGPRAITQLLHSQLAWNIDTAVETFFSEYLHLRYGVHYEVMRRVYHLIEFAGQDIAQWRAWGDNSILTQLLNWSGTTPNRVLELRHYRNHAEAIAAGKQSVMALQQALRSVKRQLKAEKRFNAQAAPEPGRLPVNPIEAATVKNYDMIEQRLADDLRSLIYGIDVFALMTSMLEYYDLQLRHEHEKAERVWRNIVQLAERMDSYCVPTRYLTDNVGYETPSALTRSQLRDTIACCRKHVDGVTVFSCRDEEKE